MKNQSVSTQKGQFNKSLGTGVKSLFSAKGRRYYILEHRTATASHRAGEVQEIIVDYIELGRDRKCQVHFDESQATVSRRHAAISAENSKWVIKNLSQSNPTLVNNRPVSNHWYLQHGDEIQLSVEGPKIGFIVPQNNTVKSIGLSRRFSLFRKQALRPYKRAIAYMGLFFLALVSALAVYLYQTREELYSYKVQLADFKEISAEQADSLTEQLSQSKKHNAVLQESFNSLQKTVKKIQQTQVSQSQSNTHPDFHFNELINGVCLVSVDKITVTYEGEMQSVENCALGTGFFLNDGRFITSRHVAEPWLYPDKGEDFLLQINLLATAGAEVVSYITAISPDGSSI
ncbi:MAG: FHA domain-containing protein, partial [Bacteroidetes bacterium]|nr:FHA domain-containing protein [Bacteroidota bacterium]